ncbi:retrovirus-related pol polyprotein from transposon TNT 1-94 [Tanacetum coccineum]
MALVLMAKPFTLNNTTPTNNNQRSSLNPSNMQIAQSDMNMDQDRQMLMVEDNVGNQFRPNAECQELARAEGNGNGINGNQIRCYNCQGVDHYARNCTVKPRKRDAAYFQTQLQIAQKEEARIQLNSEEFNFMAGAYDEIEEVIANCTLKDNLQQASTSGTQTDNAPVYDSDGSAKVHEYDNCYNNEIFNMFTQEEQYTELLEPIPEQHQVQQNDSNVTYAVSSVEQSGGTVEKHPATIEETHAYFESLYNIFSIEVEKVNTDNHKMKETNADLTTKLARYKNQEKCFEINQEKYDKLERCYQKSVYQEKCLTKKINALHLSFAKTITTLNEEIANLNNQLSKKSNVSSLQEEKKRLKFDFKICEDELLDKQIRLENKIKELDNVLVKTGQSIQTMHMLSPKPDSFYHTEQKMALGYRNPFYLKQAQQKQQSLYNGNVLLEKHDPLVEAAKFVRDFKSLANEADESLTKHKALEFEVERLLRADVSQDIMSIVQSNSLVDTSNLQTELDRTKEKLENCIIKKEKEYVRKLSLQSLRGKPPSSSSGPKLYYVTLLPKSKVIPKYVNDMKSRKKNRSANVSKSANQKKHKANVKKSKKLGLKERLASPRPSKSRTCLKWLPTRRIFDLSGTITESSNTESEFDTFVFNTASASNPQEPTNKGFPSSTSFINRFSKLQRQNSCIYPLAIF